MSEEAFAALKADIIRGLFLPPAKCGSCGAAWPHITEIKVEPVSPGGHHE